MRQWLAILMISFIVVSANSAGLDTPKNKGAWIVYPSEKELKIFFSNKTTVSQYGSLNLTSSYLRLVTGPASGWGTSIILLPVFWRVGRSGPDQGSPITATWAIVDQNFTLYINGTIAGLNVSSEVNLSPPVDESITAKVTTKVKGNVTLASRNGEAFKPVMLSSMHISPLMWDCQEAFADNRTYSIPDSGWINSTQPPTVAQDFGLIGGTSSLKKNETLKGVSNTPNIKIELDHPMLIAGWVTKSNDRNDDNIGFWASSEKVLPSWSYKVIASDNNEKEH